MIKTISVVLNELIETLKDGEKGYTSAAQDVSQPDLQKVFRDYAAQRRAFVEKLQQHVREAGDLPETSGSLAGDLHRGWMSLKSTIAPREDLAILDECLRGEELAVDTFKEALSSGELDSVRTLVETQLGEIRVARANVSVLRDAHEPPEDDGPAGDSPVALV